MCVCVRESERERQREKITDSFIDSFKLKNNENVKSNNDDDNSNSIQHSIVRHSRVDSFTFNMHSVDG